MLKYDLIDFYLDWINNYATMEDMAIDYDMSVDHCQKLIDIGRYIHAQYDPK